MDPQKGLSPGNPPWGALLGGPRNPIWGYIGLYGAISLSRAKGALAQRRPPGRLKRGSKGPPKRAQKGSGRPRKPLGSVEALYNQLCVDIQRYVQGHMALCRPREVPRDI